MEELLDLISPPANVVVLEEEAVALEVVEATEVAVDSVVDSAEVATVEAEAAASEEEVATEAEASVAEVDVEVLLDSRANAKCCEEGVSDEEVYNPRFIFWWL